MAIMTMGRRRYALAAVALGVVGSALVLWPDRGAVPGGNTFVPFPVARGTAWRTLVRSRRPEP